MGGRRVRVVVGIGAAVGGAMAFGLGPTPGANAVEVCTTSVLPDPSLCVAVNPELTVMAGVLRSPSADTFVIAGVECRPVGASTYEAYLGGFVLGTDLAPLTQDLAIPCYASPD